MARLYTLKGSGPIDRKYLSKLYAFRAKVVGKKGK